MLGSPGVQTYVHLFAADEEYFIDLYFLSCHISSILYIYIYSTYVQLRNNISSIIGLQHSDLTVSVACFVVRSSESFVSTDCL